MRGGACLFVLGTMNACTGLAGLDDLQFTAASGSGGHAGSTTSASSTAAQGGAASTAATGGAATGYAAEVLADQPLAYWRFDERPGATIASDASGNGRDGNYVGSVQLGADGVIAGDAAAHFDGNSNVVVGDFFDFVGTQPFSLEAWIKQDASGLGYQGVCSKLHTALGEGYVLYTTNPLNPKFTIYSNDMSADVAYGAAISDVVYTHLVATFDGSTARLFVNGIESMSLAAVGATADVDVPFVIGENHEGNEFLGAIDEVAVYGTALSPARVQAHYAAAR
jgi:concanavalin A-like lectin/glucanase superfamily protein